MKKPFDLSERTRLFTKRVYAYTKTLTKTEINLNAIGQLVRAAGSVSANYIEAIEHLGLRDSLMKLKICRREAKESELWLDVTECPPEQETEKQDLRAEALELVKIFSAMIRNSQGS